MTLKSPSKHSKIYFCNWKSHVIVQWYKFTKNKSIILTLIKKINKKNAVILRKSTVYIPTSLQETGKFINIIWTIVR